MPLGLLCFRAVVADWVPHVSTLKSRSTPPRLLLIDELPSIPIGDTDSAFLIEEVVVATVPRSQRIIRQPWGLSTKHAARAP